MPSTIWSRLNHLQLGKYAEYYSKMEFSSYGCDVYTSEVDDHGVDFIVKNKSGNFKEIQVKSVRQNNYTFMHQEKFNINDSSLYLVLLIFKDGELPSIYLIPSCVWKTSNPVFKVKNYDKEGQISKAEYRINISNKNMEYLAKFSFEIMIDSFLE